jgi:hypothetical protein
MNIRNILFCLWAAPFLLCSGASGHPVSDDFASVTLLKGYVKRIGGEALDYYCFTPLAKTALLTRCTTGAM